MLDHFDPASALRTRPPTGSLNAVGTGTETVDADHADLHHLGGLAIALVAGHREHETEDFILLDRHIHHYVTE